MYLLWIVHLSAPLFNNDFLEMKQLSAWEEIRVVLIWPLSPWRDEVHIILLSLLYYFLFASYWPQTVWHRASLKVTASLTKFIFLFTPPPFFFSSPCNLSLFWSSMVPTQEWSAQRKKLMKSSFPLKCRSWAEPVSTLSSLLGVSEFHAIDTRVVHKEPLPVQDEVFSQDLPGVFLPVLVH